MSTILKLVIYLTFLVFLEGDPVALNFLNYSFPTLGLFKKDF
jgi:hypothetical protein